MAKCRKILSNQSVLQYKGSGGSIPRLKLDEPSQTVATDTIELCEIVIGLGLDGQSYRLGIATAMQLESLVICNGKMTKSILYH